MHLTNSSPIITARDRHLLRHAALAVCCAGLFAALAALVQTGWGPLSRFDHELTGDLHGYAADHTVWTASVQMFSDIGGTITMRSVLGAVALWLWLIGARTLAGWVAAQTLIGWGGQWVLKLSFGRQRPAFSDPVAHASGPAFPSGHAMASAITCAVLVGLLWPRARRAGRSTACTTAALTVLAIGASRVFLGLHWTTDVLAGWLAAGIVLGAVTVIVELSRPGALARDFRRVDWRTRPRVQRVLVSSARPPRDTGPADDPADDLPDAPSVDAPVRASDTPGTAAGPATDPVPDRPDGLLR
ncbi:Membrane-associated phospholipid phosphatase [Streptomyces sp. TLI_053]|uniref:phosphatase PAP2 family protein n=1 Tax=Streptomyces sp. TLI_053 TaxID=1855352 RepID=UPI00087A4657|nr:phosphatase PAP2 family protein [Streptomyces sp. TLI_053]SDT66539.1 Membrane-associated phospholipid phosphatase [Streptomyces sp. TLI_053]